VAASSYTTSDLLVWASIATLSLHCLVMVWLIVLYGFRRARVRREA
jgi:hypothetical protein